jgi:hypothetical protein
VTAAAAQPILLTPFQAEEVEGLLSVLHDEQRLSGERAPWGHLTGRRLTVSDPADAVDDLRRRADWFETEAPGHGGTGVSAARSLRALAGKVAAEIGGPSVPAVSSEAADAR